MGQLDGRVAMVTGGGSGIGRAQAVLFGAEGARVAVADIDGERVEAVADEVVAAGGRAIGVQVGVADTASVGNAVKVVATTFGDVEILSNTAGLFDGFSDALHFDRERWDRIVAVKLTSLFVLSHAVPPAMLDKGFGRFITIASGAGLRGGGGGAAYGPVRGRGHG